MPGERDGRWWAGRVAIVIGASSGIGQATAEALLERGVRVALLARSAERLAALAAPWGEAALVLPADVRDRPTLQRQIQQAIDHWGRIDLLVYSAGVNRVQLVDELDDELRVIVETNLLGAAWATTVVVPAMRQAGFGRIVYVASVAGHVAPVGYAGYAASKWGLRALAQSLRAELGPQGIRVSLVSPTYVRTPLLDAEEEAGPLPGTAVGTVLTPAEVAQAILGVARTGEREIVLAPWALRLGLFLGQLLPGLQERVLTREGRRLIASRQVRLARDPDARSG